MSVSLEWVTQNWIHYSRCGPVQGDNPFTGHARRTIADLGQYTGGFVSHLGTQWLIFNWLSTSSTKSFTARQFLASLPPNPASSLHKTHRHFTVFKTSSLLFELSWNRCVGSSFCKDARLILQHRHHSVALGEPKAVERRELSAAFWASSRDALVCPYFPVCLHALEKRIPSLSKVRF